MFLSLLAAGGGGGRSPTFVFLMGNGDLFSF
jgi:hypothetical protein